MNIGERLTEIRKSHGYTRQKLADELGIPYTTIRNYEKGTREPGHSYLIQIADKFNVSTDYILGLEREKSPEAAYTAPEDRLITLDESNELLVKLGYIKPGEELSNDDLAFLTHLVGLLDTWFERR